MKNLVLTGVAASMLSLGLNTAVAGYQIENQSNLSAAGTTVAYNDTRYDVNTYARYQAARYREELYQKARYKEEQYRKARAEARYREELYQKARYKHELYNRAREEARYRYDHQERSNGAHTRYQFASNRQATGHKLLVISPAISRFAAYDEKGHLVRTGHASTGKTWCSDVGRSCKTPSGTFSVYKKGGADCKSSKYPVETHGGASMAHCMFFKGGYAIHASDFVPDYPASHGCVRVQPQDASWLHHNFVSIGTKVKVLPYKL